MGKLLENILQLYHKCIGHFLKTDYTIIGKDIPKVMEIILQTYYKNIGKTQGILRNSRTQQEHVKMEDIVEHKERLGNSKTESDNIKNNRTFGKIGDHKNIDK